MYTEEDELAYSRTLGCVISWKSHMASDFPNTFLLMLHRDQNYTWLWLVFILKSYQVTCWQLDAPLWPKPIQSISLQIASKVCFFPLFIFSFTCVLPQLWNQHKGVVVASSSASHCCSKAVPLPNGQLLTCGATENRTARRQTESAQRGKVGQQRRLRPWSLEWDQHFPSCDVRKNWRAAGIPCENRGQGVDQFFGTKTGTCFEIFLLFFPSFTWICLAYVNMKKEWKSAFKLDDRWKIFTVNGNIPLSIRLH